MSRLAILATLLPIALGGAPTSGAAAAERVFNGCFTDVERAANCVVDGDTFDWRGQRVRIANIDAPETHRPQCRAEADLGRRAAARLLELLNAGGWSLERMAGEKRDADQYGRLLRVVAVGDTDLGEVLVSEGLARPWDGRRHPWC